MTYCRTLENIEIKRYTGAQKVLLSFLMFFVNYVRISFTMVGISLNIEIFLSQDRS